MSDEQSFLRLEPAWNALVEAAGIDHPFLRHEWVRTWWECFGEGKELYVILVKAGEEVIAIAPLMRSRGRMYGVPVCLMEFMADDYVERFDVIIARRPEEAYRAIWKHLAGRNTRWDLLRFCQLAAGSSTLEALPEMTRREGFPTGVWRSSESPYIEFDDGWDGYLKRLSGNQRHQTLKKLKRLGHRGAVELETVSGGDPLSPALRDGFRLEAADWKDRLGTAIACRPELQRFLTQLAGVASQCGMLRLLFLKVGGVRIAFAYALCYKNTLFVLKAGYDPRYAGYSPYHLLCYLVFQDACERGLAAYEFLGNNEAWKLHWTKRTRSHYWVYVFSPSWRMRLLHAAKFRLIPRLRDWGLYRLVRTVAITLRQTPHALRKTSAPGALSRSPRGRSRASMYIPSWQGLGPGDFLGASSPKGAPFPFFAPHTTYFYMARGGIYHLMRALGFHNGTTVLMPDYHSGVEVWAVRAAGASVRYYHVNRAMEPDLDELRRLCRDNPRALYLIHYLGWPQPMKELTALCRERGMLLIEDCALALLSELDGRPLGSFGDFAVFCLYKTLPVPNGGLIVQNGDGLSALGDLELRRCDRTSVVGRSAELMLERLRSRSGMIGNALMSAKRRAGQALTSLGVRRLPVGDISPDFRSAGYDTANLDVGMSPLCHRLLNRFDYEAIRRTRRRNYLSMQEQLAGRIPPWGRELADGVCPLFFPLLVPDKQAAARALRARGIAAVELWNYGYPEAKDDEGDDARFLRRHVLELPIHQDITPSQVDYMAEQIPTLGLHF